MNWGDLVAIAFLLDLCLGDPRWLPHPVQGIALWARFLERMSRRVLPAKAAGILTTILVLAGVGGLAWVVIRAGSTIHPFLGIALQIVLLMTCFATKSLVQHARAVWTPLAAGNVEMARERVAWMVGRDTHELDEKAVIRATLESVGENTVDGITGPLLFALVGGPLGAILYKATSTLDSLFGYRNERYLAFGWAAARLDDLLNWIPARLTGPVMLVMGLLPGYRLAHGLKVYLCDRKKHPSPNAAHGEAALAGLLGVQLGGPSSYDGVPSHKQSLGEPLEPLLPHHLLKANRLAKVTAGTFMIFGWLVWFVLAGR